MAHERDVVAFDARAPDYELGWLGRLHHDIAERTLAIALALDPKPRRLLDIGCGTGYLLRQAAEQLPDATKFVGIDPAAGMIDAARAAATDDRLTFQHGTAEELAFPDSSFDLVLASTSFDHWSDQRAGLAETARVLTKGGHFVLADLLSLWLLPTTLTVRRGRVRTIRRARAMLEDVGLQPIGRHNLYVIIGTVSATKPAT
jgi:ubiquinone/menaquinone biosynthesis C-methylase UbiE